MREKVSRPATLGPLRAFPRANLGLFHPVPRRALKRARSPNLDIPLLTRRRFSPHSNDALLYICGIRGNGEVGHHFHALPTRLALMVTRSVLPQCTILVSHLLRSDSVAETCSRVFSGRRSTCSIIN